MGEVVNDLREGVGIYYYKTGEVYAGQWTNNQLHGNGTYIFSNGEKYEGEISDGKKVKQMKKNLYFYIYILLKKKIILHSEWQRTL